VAFSQLWKPNLANLYYTIALGLAYQRHQWIWDPDYASVQDHEAWIKIRRDPVTGHAIIRRRAGVAALGIVFGGSGNGEQMAANKVHGIRAALVWSVATAELAREHNAANVIAIGARQHSFDEAKSFIEAFISTPFSGEERHARRIAQLAEQRAEQAQHPVADNQKHRHGQHRMGGIQRVDNLLEQQRHGNIGELGQHQQAQCNHHAPLEFPQIRQQGTDGLPIGAGAVI